MARMGPKEKILSLLEKSSAATPRRGMGRQLHDSYMRHISFRDIIDIVLYYISLQPDVRKITKIKSRDFYELLEKTWNEWREKVEKRWGYKYYEYPLNSGQMHKTLKFYDVNAAWSSGPGPMGGTMGPAEDYALLRPGFLQHDFLLLFFVYPAGLPDTGGNWSFYRKHHIEARVFPKWRRKEHRKKLEMAFTLAEMVCERLREKGAQKT